MIPVPKTPAGTVSGAHKEEVACYEQHDDQDGGYPGDDSQRPLSGKGTKYIPDDEYHTGDEKYMNQNVDGEIHDGMF